MESVSLFATVALVHLLAIASPGPTFMVISSYAMAGDRRAGFLATLGVLLATLLWASLAVAGLGIVIAGLRKPGESPRRSACGSRPALKPKAA